MTTRVSPFSVSPTAFAVDSLFLYELVCAEELPTVDLSVSIKSRLVRKSWQPTVTRMLRRGKTIFVMFIVGIALGTILLLCDARIGRMLGILAFVLQVPAPLAGLMVLRFHVVRELVRTFDCWFFFIVTTISLVLLGAQLADSRMPIVLATWIGLMPNMLIDAHIRRPKRMAFSNVFAIGTTAIFLGGIKFSGIDEANNFAVFRRGKRILRSDEFVFNGMVTIFAVLARTIVRLRAALSADNGSNEVQCISYRSVLRLVPKTHAGHHQRRRLPSIFTKRQRTTTIPSVNPIQSLTLKTASDAIDAHFVLWPRVVFWIADDADHLPFAFRCLGWSSFTLSTIATVFIILLSGFGTAIKVACVSTALSTCVFFGITAASLQRQLLWRLVSSFDFLYLSAQVTVLHLIVCDVCAWKSSRCLIVVISWLWIHWALCMDAVSPILKNVVRVHLRFPAIVLSVSVLNSMVVVCVIVLFDISDGLYDRVLLLFDAKLSVNMVPMFVNSLATVLLIGTRLLYRAWTFNSDWLLLLEGEVVYQNYLANARLMGKAFSDESYSQPNPRGSK